MRIVSSKFFKIFIIGHLVLFAGVLEAWAISISEYSPLPAGYSMGKIIVGPDGLLWTVATKNLTVFPYNTGYLVQLANNGSSTRSFVIDQGSLSSYGPVITGPDGKFWIGPAASGGWIGRATTTQITDGISTPAGQNLRIGPPDRTGGVWVVLNNSTFARIAIDGTFTTKATLGFQIDSMVLGPDGNIWFAGSARNAVGYVTPSGSVTTFTVPTPNAFPVALTVGPDGNIWFTESDQFANKVGMVTPAGVFTEFVFAPPGSPEYARSMTLGVDGNLWFTAEGSNLIRQITTGGAATAYSTPLSQSHPNNITSGPDGKVWFTEFVDVNNSKLAAVNGIAIPLQSNDPFTSATSIAGNTGHLFANNINATAESGEPAHAGVTAMKSLWWRWTAPSNGQLVLSTHGSSYETVIGVYTGSALTALTPVVTSGHMRGNGLSYVVVAVQSGTTYYVAVDGYNGATGLLLLDWRMALNPSADLAFTITGPQQPIIGVPNSYTLSLTNQGPNYATHPSVFVTLPASVTFVSAPDCTLSNQTVTCLVDWMYPGETRVFTLTMQPNSLGDVTLSGTATSDASDTTSTNNSSSITTTVVTAPIDDTDIPTLPQWGMIFMALLLVGVAISREKRVRI